jgi:lipoprotein-releasing system permease protein
MMADEPEVPTVDFDALPPIEEGGSLRAEWWLASGHLRGHEEAFVGLVTLIAVGAVTIGVALLNAVLAVMTGFEVDLREKILGANAHVVVMRYGSSVTFDEELHNEILSVDGVTAAAPFIYSEMMLRSKYASSGVILKGADPTLSGDVTQVRDQLILSVYGEPTTPEAKAEAFAMLGERIKGGGPEGDEDYPTVFIGDELMETLQVLPGDKVQVINPLGSGKGMLGMPTPTVRTFRVGGVFHSGMYEYDTKWTYVSIPEAQSFLKMDGVTGVELVVEDIDDVQRIADELEDGLGYPYFARHWRNMNQALFEALAMEKAVTGVVLGLVNLIAGMLIISNLYMLVITKRRDIAVLKAMGASQQSLVRVFVMVGGAIGIVGTTVGTALGLAICEGLKVYEWPLETDVYYLSSLPVLVQTSDIVVIGASALVICFLSALYPAMRAASLDPVEGLRYE